MELRTFRFFLFRTLGSLILGTLFWFIASGTVAAQSNANLTLVRTPDAFEYTISNDDPVGSAFVVDVVSLPLLAPISAVESPTGWTADTDLETFIQWHIDGPSHEFSVSPGSSLSGFRLITNAMTGEEVNYSLSLWDTSLDEPGPEVGGLTQVPNAAPTPVREATTGVLIALGAVILIIMLMRTRRCRYMIPHHMSTA